MATATATPVKEKLFMKFKTSQFSFMKCLRCLYLEIMFGIKQPDGPSSFGALMRQKSEQVKFLADKSLHILGKGFPKGTLHKTNGRFSTVPFEVDGVDVQLTGAYDFLIKRADGKFALACFKNSDPNNNDNVTEYAKQLNAIAYALEHDEKNPIKISQLGIFWFDPTAFYAGKTNDDIYTWIPVELAQDDFKALLIATVVALKDGEPEAGVDDKEKMCSFCKRDKEVIAYQINKK